jgi:hypothetical protein
MCAPRGTHRQAQLCESTATNKTAVRQHDENIAIETGKNAREIAKLWNEVARCRGRLPRKCVSLVYQLFKIWFKKNQKSISNDTKPTTQNYRARIHHGILHPPTP